MQLDIGLSTMRAEPKPSGSAGVGARHPNITPNTRSGQGRVGGGGCCEYKLTTYTACWWRMEKLGNKFYNEVKKEDTQRLLRKKERRKRKKEELSRRD